jgi:hypothetical protein
MIYITDDRQIKTQMELIKCQLFLKIEYNLIRRRGEFILKISHVSALTRWLSFGIVCKRILLRAFYFALILNCTQMMTLLVNWFTEPEIGRAEYFALPSLRFS